MALLKLMALDDEDLEIISAYCQDAVVRVADLQLLKKEQRFLATFNRFAWETAKKRRFFSKHRKMERRRANLQFTRVLNVQMRGFSLKKEDDILSLLMIGFQSTNQPQGIITMLFSGSAAIRLEVECIEAQLCDLGAGWQTNALPKHN